MPSDTRDPVLERIGDRDLYVGDATAARGTHDVDFDAVLSVCRRPLALTSHHEPLRDGPGNTQAALDAAFEAARDLHVDPGPLLVNCAAGISRSTTVVATTIAAEEGRRFDEAVGIVREYRELANPAPSLRAHAKTHLSRLDGHDERPPVPAVAETDPELTCTECEEPIRGGVRATSFDRSGEPIHTDCRRTAEFER